MNTVGTILKDYLALRRSLGFKLQKHETTLGEFVSFFRAQKASYLTTGLALRWARNPKDADPAWWTDRLGMLRGFAAYWKTLDPRIEVPPLRLLLPQYKRPSPYIYTGRQICQILAATRQLASGDNLTYWTLWGLLAVTGMRVGEALALNDEDVDLKQGTITVRDAKLSTSRRLPLHPTTRRILRRYVQQRRRRFPRPKSSSFLLIVDGRRPSHAVVWKTFQRVLTEAGIDSLSHQKSPRIHDLRHSFAVNALIGFYRKGQDVDRRIHALSTYLGHKSVRCTYWYLTSVPELMSLALARLEKKIGGAS
ncbi:MAG: tyrosine-type recombinase/integrase [Phycisphaerae bacterium]